MAPSAPELDLTPDKQTEWSSSPPSDKSFAATTSYSINGQSDSSLTSSPTSRGLIQLDGDPKFVSQLSVPSQHPHPIKGSIGVLTRTEPRANAFTLGSVAVAGPSIPAKNGTSSTNTREAWHLCPCLLTHSQYRLCSKGIAGRIPRTQTALLEELKIFSESIP